MQIKIMFQLLVAYLCLLVLMSVITYYLIYPLAVDKGTAIATMFGWSAGLFAPFSALILLNSWKEQHNINLKKDFIVKSLGHLDEAIRAIGQIYWLIYINDTKDYFYPYNQKRISQQLDEFIMSEHSKFVLNLGNFHKTVRRIVGENAEFKKIYNQLNKFHAEIIKILDIKRKCLEVDTKEYNKQFSYLYDYYHELILQKEKFEKIAQKYLIVE